MKIKKGFAILMMLFLVGNITVSAHSLIQNKVTVIEAVSSIEDNIILVVQGLHEGEATVEVVGTTNEGVLIVTDSEGVIISTSPFNPANTQTINVGEWVSGVYTFSFSLDGKVVATAFYEIF